MKPSRTLLLILPLALALGAGVAIACPGDDGATTTAAAPVPADLQLVTLRVESATCGSCVLPIRKELTQLAGVFSVESSEDDYKDVLVKVAPGKVTNEQLLAAVKKAGYDAVIKKPVESKTS